MLKGRGNVGVAVHCVVCLLWVRRRLHFATKILELARRVRGISSTYVIFRSKRWPTARSIQPRSISSSASVSGRGATEQHFHFVERPLDKLKLLDRRELLNALGAGQLDRRPAAGPARQ